MFFSSRGTLPDILLALKWSRLLETSSFLVDDSNDDSDEDVGHPSGDEDKVSASRNNMDVGEFLILMYYVAAALVVLLVFCCFCSGVTFALCSHFRRDDLARIAGSRSLHGAIMMQRAALTEIALLNRRARTPSAMEREAALVRQILRKEELREITSTCTMIVQEGDLIQNAEGEDEEIGLSINKDVKALSPQEHDRTRASINRVRNVTNHCTICLDKYYIGQKVVWSPNGKCNHVFHEDCILHWLSRSTVGATGENERRPLCPVCRQDFISPYTCNSSKDEGSDVDIRQQPHSIE
eukprot:CAMPEP_0116028366 /NCGR_PEP_ID=MMETSP0321-20121206/15350_1 /TAXON_ID=163516 /ORGANISM="Leptocylindrus danicus var. danicus, Strain B650" /LENGTH=295 /DNA_ID=CAMNT_0003502235 /DNA_START=221 /DNA_END=1108 /DNA_ORIENTATION=+